MKNIISAKKIDHVVKKKKTSIPKWAGHRLFKTIETKWPKHYFALLGSLANISLERPPQSPI